MTPDTRGEIYEYTPTWTEVRIGAGIFAIGFMVFTVLCRVAIPILQGEYDDRSLPASETAPLTQG